MTPAPPNPITGIGVVARFHGLRLFRSHRIWMAATATGLIDVVAWTIRYSRPDLEVLDMLDTTIRFGYFSLLVFLVPFLLTTGIIAEEVEGRTLPFLFVRPVPRSALALGKFVAAVGIAVGFIAVGLLLLHLGLFATEPTLLVDELPQTARIIGALSLLATLYGAVCAFWGALLPEAAGVVSALYLGVFEFSASILPATLRFLSMNHWAVELAGIKRGGLLPESVPDVELWIAGTLIGGELVLFVGFMVLIVAQSEFRFGKA